MENVAGTTRLTAALAMVRYLGAQGTEVDGVAVPLFAGCWAIFGNGPEVGEALRGIGDAYPTFRAHDESAMPAPERALHGLTDPADRGPVTLSSGRDVRAEAHNDPERFFAPRRIRQPHPGPVRGVEGGSRRGVAGSRAGPREAPSPSPVPRTASPLSGPPCARRPSFRRSIP